jgi:hypothetical protein
MGWDRLRNGFLLDQAQAAFDVLLTVDKGFRYQQTLSGRPIAVVLMRARDNRLTTLRALVPDVLAFLPTVQPGQLYEVPTPIPPPPLPQPAP